MTLTADGGLGKPLKDHYAVRGDETCCAPARRPVASLMACPRHEADAVLKPLPGDPRYTAFLKKMDLPHDRRLRAAIAATTRRLYSRWMHFSRS